MSVVKVVIEVLLSSVIVVSCVMADCGSPPNIPNTGNNITGSPPYPHSATVRYYCDLGYNPVAGTSRDYTCNYTDWTDGNFRCEQIYCSYVEPPENGRTVNTPTYEVGSVIQFACDEGCDMSGQSTMTCRTDGNWLPSAPPTCTLKDCGEFGSIQYADTFQDNSEIERNHYGSVVEVTCQNGKILNGPPHVKCEANGQWGERPTCVVLPCPTYPNTNSSCVKAAQLAGNFYFILCKENVSTRAGPDAAECISGEWDSTEMACLCDCVIPEYNSSLFTVTNLNSFGNIPHVTALEWTCKSGSSRSSIEHIVCIDGTLKAEKDGQEVIIANNSNPSDINRIIMSEICVLPTTEPSTGTTSESTSVPSTSTISGSMSVPSTSTLSESTSVSPTSSKTESSTADDTEPSSGSSGKYLTTTMKTDRNRINSANIGLNNQLCFCIFILSHLFKMFT